MIRVRRARPSDASDIGWVHVETWRDTYAGILPNAMLVRMSTEVEGGHWGRVLSRGRETVLVAEYDVHGVIGFGSCGRCRSAGLGYDGEVYTLYVLPDYQDQGAGRRLLEALFKDLRDDGYRSALIWVLHDNPSRYFYEAMNGRHVADRTERLWGKMVAERAYGWDELE